MSQASLYIIATPIGNMEDITIRALNILKEVVHSGYCEDTRQTKKLLNYHNISLKLQSLHAHSSDSKHEQVIKDLKCGNSIAYMTDSGTPGISDPGNRLVQLVSREGIPVIPVPGPSALSAILSVSGFSGKKVIFTGFVSKKPGKRINELEKLKEAPGIVVLYESPHRIHKLLEALYEVFPNTSLVIGRELTKKFEEIIYTDTTEMHNFPDKIKQKGEFVMALHYDPKKEKKQ